MIIVVIIYGVVSGDSDCRENDKIKKKNDFSKTRSDGLFLIINDMSILMKVTQRQMSRIDR